jgi:hypothetical protein
MAELTLRLIKGAPLTNEELDANFANLNSELLGKQAALGYTPANKAGDTFTGAVLTSNAGGFTANSAAKLWTDSGRGRLDLWEGPAQTKSLRVFNANGYGVIGMVSAENLELWTSGVARVTINGTTGNVTATGSLTATSFSGSASGLTGLKTVNGNSIIGSGNIQIDGGVTSFNTRTGAVTLSSGDVTTALGFTPLSNATSYLPLAGGTLTGNVQVNNGTDSRFLLQVSGTVQGQFQANETTVRLSSNNTLPLNLSTSGVDRITLASSGLITFATSAFLGLGGTPSSSVRLRVYGSGTTSEVARIDGGTLESQLIINQSDDPSVNTNRAQLSLRKNNVVGATISIDGASANRGIVYYDAYSATGSHAFYVNSTDRFRINAAGAVSFSSSYGTAGQMLKSGGSAGVPTWGSLTSGEVTTALGFTPYNAGSNTVLTSANFTSYAANGIGNTGGADLNTITTSGMYRVNATEANRPGDYGQLLVIRGGSDTITQIYGQYNGSLSYRSGNPTNVGGTGSYQAWRTLLDSSNYNSYALPLSGGTLSGALTVSGQLNVSGSKFYTASNNSGESFDVYIDAGGGANAWRHIYGGTGTGYGVGVGGYGIYYDGNPNYNAIFAPNGGVSFPSARPTALGNVMLDAGNYSSYALPLSGGTLSGYLYAPKVIINANSDISWGGEYSGGKPTIAASSSALYFYPTGGSSGQTLLLSNSSTTTSRELIVSTGGAAQLQLVSPSGTQSLWVRAGYTANGTGTPASSLYNVQFQSSGSSGGTFSFCTGNDVALSIAGGAINSFVALQQGGNQVLHAGNYSNYVFGWRGQVPTNGWNDATTGMWVSYDQTNQTGGPGGYSYGGLLSFRASDYGNNHRAQMYFSHTGEFKFRTGWNDWSYGWYTVLNSSNYSSYALPLSGGTIAGNGTVDFGPNSTWGATLRVGGNGHSGTGRASVVTTNGNLHLDGAASSGVYLNWYATSTTGTYFGNGAGGQVGRVDASGNVTFNGIINTPSGYVSNGNPWGTANSAFFPNGITTAGSTNWIYGATYIGNAPGNGSGLEVSSNGRLYGSVSSGTAMHVRRTGSASNATNSYTALFEQTYGDHSWGIVAEFRAGEAGGSDRPSILFSNGYNSTTWSVGFGYYDDQFRIRQNHGHRNGDWGTERFRIDTGGTPYFNGNVALHAGNYSSYALPLSGGTVTGVAYFQTDNGGYVGSTSNARLQAYSSGNNAAYLSFHKGGHYAVNMGLDADNVIRIGGWSASANRWQLDMSGNGTYAGNVTAYSDERLKKDWAPLAPDYVSRLALVKSGTYTRIDSGERQAGASAQDWQKLLPEVVTTNNDDDKTLALAYGNAALVSAIELAKDNVELRARIERLESLINKLIGD